MLSLTSVLWDALQYSYFYCDISLWIVFLILYDTQFCLVVSVFGLLHHLVFLCILGLCVLLGRVTILLDCVCKSPLFKGYFLPASCFTHFHPTLEVGVFHIYAIVLLMNLFTWVTIHCISHGGYGPLFFVSLLLWILQVEYSVCEFCFAFLHLASCFLPPCCLLLSLCYEKNSSMVCKQVEVVVSLVLPSDKCQIHVLTPLGWSLEKPPSVEPLDGRQVLVLTNGGLRAIVWLCQIPVKFVSWRLEIQEPMFDAVRWPSVSRRDRKATESYYLVVLDSCHDVTYQM